MSVYKICNQDRQELSQRSYNKLNMITNEKEQKVNLSIDPRNKLTGSVSRKNSSDSSDSDSDSNNSHKRRKITKKKNKLQTIREEKVEKMRKKRGKAKAGVTMNYSEDEKSEDGTSSDEENLRTPALVEENSKLEVGFE